MADAKPRIISRQEGSFTWSFGVGTTQDITITTVNIDRSWCRISLRVNNSTKDVASVHTTARLTSSTNLRLQRGSTSASVTVEWVVIEFDSSVNVYRGSFTQNAVTVDTTVTSVNLNKSISEVTYRTTSTYASTFEMRNSMMRNRLTSSTNLRTNLYSADANSTVEYQIIEFTEGVNVSKYEGNYSNWNIPLDVTITSVNMNKSFVLFSWTPNNTDAMGSEDLLWCQMISADKVRIQDYYATSGSDKVYAFYVAEFTAQGNNANVSRGSTSFTGASVTPTISCTKTRAIHFIGANYGNFIGVNRYDQVFDNHAITTKITSDTVLTGTRYVGSYTATLPWEVVTFPSTQDDIRIVQRIIYNYRQRRV